MRSTLILLVFLATGSLGAQSYLQNAQVQQTQSIVDCYTQNLDKGNAALRRGEPREAINFFNYAKDCPEAKASTRRQSEIQNRIERCETQLGIRKASVAQDNAILTPQKRSFSAEAPITRRNYAAKHDLLKDTLDDCFGRMVSEANRAYQLKFWEDAAALYRAAKNCADADQNDRQQMSERISDCRNAAENELFAKQQEAERQARHAIAANLADDAQELLKNTDRSLAFRLADFANQYVAPDDNPDCVQAMFDAWYYQPNETSKYRGEELYHPVFCYELADNLGENAQIKFQQLANGRQLLWAFLPKTGELTAWEIPEMKIVQSYDTGEGNSYTGFDFSPAGELLFWGNKFFDLRQGNRSTRVDVPGVTNWCFNARGDEFFFENLEDKKIMILSLKEVFAQQNSRRGAKNTNMVQLSAVPREFVSGVPEGLLAMQYIDGKFWLGFRDRVEVLSKAAPGKPWNREKTFRFEGVNIPDFVEQKELRLEIFPNEGFAILGFKGQTWPITLNDQQDSSKTASFQTFRPIAVSGKKHQVAGQYSNFPNNTFCILDVFTGDTLRRQQILQYGDFEPFSGIFSSDARWVAAATLGGTLNVWTLENTPTSWVNQLPQILSSKPVFSPDGNYLFCSFNDTLALFNTSNSSRPVNTWINSGQPLVGASDQWALVQISPDSAEAKHLTNGQKLRFPLRNEGYSYPYSVDSKGERLIAYLSDWDKVEVRSLKSGALVASKLLNGGTIEMLQFIPGTDNLVLVQRQSVGEFESGESSVKIWSPLQEGTKPRAFRLHEYPIQAMTIDKTGTKAAFSNGNDIRVFDLNNIENEVLKIRAAANDQVQAVTFRDNSTLLAAAYASGKIILWNVLTGQASLQLQAVQTQSSSQNYAEISSIAFSQNGSVLQIAVMDGRVLSFVLDPSYIRSVAQDEKRQLQTFSVEQLVGYNLEAALYYPGNFERLAASGDAPLVRSFFQYFKGQALESNNISQVRDYCDRAFYLYERLAPKTKEVWGYDMSNMYEDYTKKLLLRGNISKAAEVIQFIQKAFDSDPVLLNAHVALLQRKFAEASALYSSYFLINQLDGTPLAYEARWRFEQVEKDMLQFRDFEILDSLQTSCFCGTVSLSGGFSTFCPLGNDYPTDYLSRVDRMHWEIVQNLNTANNTLRLGNKTKALDEAYEKAKVLVQQNPAKERVWLETVSLELASIHRKWGVFEQNSPEALLHFEKSIQLLTETGAFKSISDTSRLALLTSTRLAWGKYLLDTGKPSDALSQFQLGLESAQPLSEIVFESDTTLLMIYYDHLVGPIYEKMGTAFLLSGKTAEARRAYEQANTFYVTYGLNALFLANVAVLENDSIQAFLDYGGIATASQTAVARFVISQLIEQFPEKQKQIESYIPKLISSLRSKNRRLVSVETDYWFANLKVEHYAGLAKWDSAIVWSNEKMECAKRCMEQPNSDEQWKTLWLDEHISLPYYLLMGSWNKPAVLNKCIQYVQDAQAFIKEKEESEVFYYTNQEMLKTNLAHALILRNNPGDREKAMVLYAEFIQSYGDPRGYDNVDLLKKDFKDLRAVGAPFPELPEIETKGEE
jgi:WD40 repeat protein